MRNKPSVLGYVVAKRAQEAKEETIKKHSKGRIVPKGIQANSLETFGVNIIFEEVLLEIHKALPGKKIFICADKDAEVRSNATNQFKTGPNAGKDILPKNSYQWTYDAAYLFKNIHATVGKGLPVGCSKDKFTKKQLTELGTHVIPNKSAVKEKRRMSQKRNNNMGTYANRAQREIDSKRAEERAKLQKQKSNG